MSKMNKITCTASLWACFSFSTSIFAGPLDISDVPLELTPAVAPNILVVSDDSESMDWEIVTQDIVNNGVLFFPTINGSGSPGNSIVPRVDDGDGAADGNAANPCSDYTNPAASGGSGDYVDGYIYIVAFPSNQTIPTDTTGTADAARINCYVADDDEWRARSYTFNALYF